MGKNDLLYLGAALGAAVLIMPRPQTNSPTNLVNEAQKAVDSIVTGAQGYVNYAGYVATNNLPGYNPLSGVGLFNNGVYVGGYDPTLYAIYQATGI